MDNEIMIMKGWFKYTSNRLSIRNSLRHIGDLHLVLPSIQDYGILIMVQQIRLMMVSLNRVDHSKMFLLFEFCCGSTPSCLKVKGLGPGLDNTPSNKSYY